MQIYGNILEGPSVTCYVEGHSGRRQAITHRIRVARMPINQQERSASDGFSVQLLPVMNPEEEEEVLGAYDSFM